LTLFEYHLRIFYEYLTKLSTFCSNFIFGDLLKHRYSVSWEAGNLSLLSGEFSFSYYPIPFYTSDQRTVPVIFDTDADCIR